MRWTRLGWATVAVFCAVACAAARAPSNADDAGADAGTASTDATLDALGDGSRDSSSPGDAGNPNDAPLDVDLADAPDDAAEEAAEDAGPALVPGCPFGVPEAGVGCDTPGLWCEYGGGAHERCSTSAYCGPAHWTLFPPDPSCTLTNAAVCPSTYGEPSDASCPLAQGSCDYDAGSCACVECSNNDGGHDGNQWFCRAWGDVHAYSDDSGAEPLNLPNACPADRPRLGTACDAGFECGYEACYGVSLGPYEWCSYGSWGRGPQTDLCNPPACR